MFIWRLGETDVKGLLKAGGESALLKYVSKTVSHLINDHISHLSGDIHV